MQVFITQTGPVRDDARDNLPETAIVPQGLSLVGFVTFPGTTWF